MTRYKTEWPVLLGVGAGLAALAATLRTGFRALRRLGDGDMIDKAPMLGDVIVFCVSYTNALVAILLLVYCVSKVVRRNDPRA